MFNRDKNEAKSYAIIGLGRFGTALSLELAKSGAELIVLDRDEDKIREIREYTQNAYLVKSLDKKALQEAGVQNCDVAVVCIGEMLDASILTTLNLVSLGIKHVIAKATSMEHGEVLEKLGAEVVYPERDIAIRLAHRLETSQVLDYIQLSEQLDITKLIAPDSIVGKTIEEINIRKKYGANIIAIENGRDMNASLTPDYVFKAGDILFLSGRKEDLARIKY